MSGNRVLSPAAAAAKFGRSRHWLYRVTVKDPRFPRPVRIPGRGVQGEPGWPEDELDLYIEVLKADRDAETRA